MSACSVCGVERSPDYPCNRAVCGHDRTFVFSYLTEIGGKVTSQNFQVPANMHRRRIENDLLRGLSDAG